MTRRLIQFADRIWASDLSLSALALFSFLVSFVLFPLAEGVAWLSGVLILPDMLFGLVIVTAVTAVTQRAAVGGLVTLAILVQVAIRVAIRFGPHPRLLIVELLLSVALVGILLGIVVVLSLRGGPVTPHRILGAVLAYLLIAVLWGRVYELLYRWVPGAIVATARPVESLDPLQLMYFSVMTMTTVGYGDFVPVHPAAQALTCLEAIAGTLFPVVFIGRFVIGAEFRDGSP